LLDAVAAGCHRRFPTAQRSFSADRQGNCPVSVSGKTTSTVTPSGHNECRGTHDEIFGGAAIISRFRIFKAQTIMRRRQLMAVACCQLNKKKEQPAMNLIPECNRHQ